ncbi:LysR family transcriptional regulator [Paucilactobacillus sp. N302-9]
MKLNELTYFVTVVEEKSFSSAADKLFISQPSLTMSIKHLETELGRPLINRARGVKSISLTLDGELVYIHAKRILKEIDIIVDEVQSNNHAKAKLGVPAIIGAYLFPKIMRFMEPNILENLELVETGSANMRQLLLDDKINMAIIGTLSKNENRDFDRYLIMQDKYALFVPCNHPLATRTSVSIEELKNEHFVSLGKNYLQYTVLKQLCIDHHMENKIKNLIISNEFETVNSLISNGAGIGLMTTYSLGNARGITVVPLKESIYCYFYLVFKKENELSKFEIEVKNDILRADSGEKIQAEDVF